jgi:PTS system N-acetylglucosamine-specific IIC component
VGPVADQLAASLREAIRDGTASPDISPERVLAALGGRKNVRSIERAAGRILVTVDDAARVDDAALVRLGVRGVAPVSATSVHVLVAEPDALATRLEPMLA